MELAGEASLFEGAPDHAMIGTRLVTKLLWPSGLFILVCLALVCGDAYLGLGFGFLAYAAGAAGAALTLLWSIYRKTFRPSHLAMLLVLPLGPLAHHRLTDNRRLERQEQLETLAHAVERYIAVEGVSPSDPSQLVPRYLAALPANPLGNDEWAYAKRSPTEWTLTLHLRTAAPLFGEVIYWDSQQRLCTPVDTKCERSDRWCRCAF